MTKQKVIEKLWNNESLSNEDLVFISKNLHEGEGKSEFVPYNHESKTVWGACGVNEEEVEEMNTLINKILKDGKKSKMGLSELVEKIELATLGNGKAMRMMIFQIIKTAIERQNPLLGLLRGLSEGRIPPGDGDDEEEE